MRDAEPSDAPVLAALITELGHPADPTRVARHIELLKASPLDRIVVAENGSGVVGMAGLRISVFIHRPRPVARLTTMIVTTDARRGGVGRALVERIELLAQQAGCGALELTTGMEREDAQRFYEALGFERTSVRFWKAL